MLFIKRKLKQFKIKRGNKCEKKWEKGHKNVKYIEKIYKMYQIKIKNIFFEVFK